MEYTQKNPGAGGGGVTKGTSGALVSGMTLPHLFHVSLLIIINLNI